MFSIKATKRERNDSQTCIFTEWTPRKIDKYVMLFEIECRSEITNILWKRNITADQPVSCGNVSTSNVNSVIIRRVFMKEKGGQLQYNLALVRNDQEKDNTTLVVLSVAGTFVGMCIMLLIVVLYMHKKNEPKNVEPTYLESQDITIDTTDKKVEVDDSHIYKELNIQDIKQDIYYKLTPPINRRSKGRFQLRYSHGKIKSFKKSSTKSLHHYEAQEVVSPKNIEDDACDYVNTSLCTTD